MRGQRARLRRLAASCGNAGWGWDDVLPYFRKQRGPLPRRRRALHGAGGEWRVERAAAALGHPRRLPRRGGSESAFRAATISTAATTRARLFRGQPAARRALERGARPSCKPVAGRANLTRGHRRAGRRGSSLEDGRVHRRRVSRARRRRARSRARAREVAARGRRDRLAAAPRSCPASATATLLRAARHSASCTTLPGVGENLQDHLQLRWSFKVSDVAHAQHASRNRWSARRDRRSSTRCGAAGR